MYARIPRVRWLGLEVRMKFNVGDILKYSYDPRGVHAPGWLRARVVKVNRKTGAYEFEVLEYYGSWSGKKISVCDTDAIQRIDEICEKITDEENRVVEETLKALKDLQVQAQVLLNKYNDVLKYQRDNRIQIEVDDE